MLEQETIRLQIEHETFNDFKPRVMRCFDLIPTDLIDRTIRSMPKRYTNQVLNVNSTRHVHET